MGKNSRFLWLVLAFLCILAGCGKNKAPEAGVPPVPQPPNLVVTVPEGSVTRGALACAWHYLKEDGTMGSPSWTPGIPADWWNRESQLMTAGQIATLTFALPADEITVTCYSSLDGSVGSCSLDENGTLTLCEGRWAYEIRADWTDESRDYYGFAEYTVFIEKK